MKKLYKIIVFVCRSPVSLCKLGTLVAKGSQEVKSPSHARGRYISGSTLFLENDTSSGASNLRWNEEWS